MTTEVQKLLVKVEATQRKFEKQMNAMSRKSRETSVGMERDFRKSNRNVDKSFVGLQRRSGRSLKSIALRATAIVAAITLVGTAVVKAAKNGEKLLLVEKRLEAITGSSARAEASLDAILQVADLTGAGVDGVASAFSRYTLAAQEIGATTQEVEQLTKTILQLGAVGGGTQTELSAGAQQLGQSLAKGVLNGDELRSVMENIPLVAKQIADGLGVGVGQLKEMGANGELTSRLVFDALLSGADAANKKFETLPPTIERASGRMATAWTVFSARINESIGLSRTLANVINGVANRLNELTQSEDQALISTKNRIVAEIDKKRSDVAKTAGGAYSADIGIAKNYGNPDLVKSLRIKQAAAVAKATLKLNKRRRDVVAQINELEGRIQTKKDAQFDIEKAKGITAGREKAGLEQKAALAELERRKQLTFLDARTRKIKEAGAAAAAAFKAKAPFATKAQIAEVQSAAEKTRAAEIDRTGTGGKKNAGTKAANAAEKRAKEIIDSARSSAQEYADALAEINSLKKEGYLTTEQYTKAIEHLADQYDPLTQGMKEFGQTAKEGLLDALAAGENLDDVFKTLKTSIKRAAYEALLFGAGPFSKSGGGAGILGSIGKAVGSILSLDGGGYTGDGARSGGLDGKGGFLAINHPQETMIDHTKGQSASGGPSVLRIELGDGVKAEILKIANDRSNRNAFQIVQAASAVQQEGLGSTIGEMQERGAT